MDLFKNLPYIKDLSYFKKEYKVLIYGLDASGKTNVLYKLKTGQFLKTVPTIGFNVETIEYKNNSITIWDISARVENFYLRYYTPNTNALIIVVDSTDNDERLIDLPNSRTNQELCEKLELNKIIPYIFHCQFVLH
ncbi:unnamed protein product [Cunninghamella echinulata]